MTWWASFVKSDKKEKINSITSTSASLQYVANRANKILLPAEIYVSNVTKLIGFGY